MINYTEFIWLENYKINRKRRDLDISYSKSFFEHYGMLNQAVGYLNKNRELIQDELEEFDNE